MMPETGMARTGKLLDGRRMFSTGVCLGKAVNLKGVALTLLGSGAAVVIINVIDHKVSHPPLCATPNRDMSLRSRQLKTPLLSQNYVY